MAKIQKLALLLSLLPTFLEQATAATNVTLDNESSLLWGAYRPNLYFGLRPQIPESVLTGLVWFGTHDFEPFSKARHACDQGDGLDSYTWTVYDAREGGVQVIKDGYNNVKLTTEFLKVPGGQHGGSWAARVKGEPINPDRPSRVSTIFYMGGEGGNGLVLESDEDEDGLEGPVVLSGTGPELGDFTIRVVDSPGNTYVTKGIHSEAFENRLEKTHFAGYRVPSGHIWQAKELILQSIVKHAREALEPYQNTPSMPDPSFLMQLPDETFTGSSLYAIQKTFEGPFQYDIFFESESAKQKLSSSILDKGIASLKDSYSTRFETVFPLPANYEPFNGDRESLKAFSQAVTANLIGGVGYFYGASIVDKGFAYEWDQDESADDKHDKGARLTEPRALLTATPSRSFFPRGFYWDEGFHLLHIGEWDNDLSLKILKDWVDLIDDDGWVAREQILGEEARSKVPAEFQTQVPSYANPPTLTMAVTAFVKRLRAAQSAGGPSDADLGLDFGLGGAQVPLSGSAGGVQAQDELRSRYLSDPEKAQEYVKSIYAPLKRHYDWFRRTQRGQIKQYARKARSRTEGYRWRGHAPSGHLLTSGMDDYPRDAPHAGELHLDLISWMGFFTRTMRDIAEVAGEMDDMAAFEEIEKAILGNIDDLHWSEEQQMYCDVSVNEDDESYHVCNKGYLSLFPLLLGLLPPDSPRVGAILDILRDPQHLWSPYGLRSLSASHSLFGTSENYWRGPIWVQMNYLALQALYTTYAAKPGPYQERAKTIYRELRKNILDNVHKEYERTGYVWEQYDPITGEGKRSHPFTGWTSLVTLILSEKY